MQINGDYINIYNNQNNDENSDNSESFQIAGTRTQAPKSVEKKEITLRYVPLEIVSSAHSNESKEKIYEIKNDSSENVSVVHKSSTMNTVRSKEDGDRMYTDWDMMRTLALKNAQAEFHNHNFL